MKKYIGFLGAALLCLSIISCNKKDFDYPEGTVGGSKITSYPTFTLTGGSVAVIGKGGTFTDPGVVAKEGTNEIKVTTSGTVNPNVAGVYFLTYSATNKDGYSASANRTIIVSSPDATAAANDFSGTYLRSATGYSAVWTKIGPGVYQVNNPGGAKDADGVLVYAFNQTGNTVKIIDQDSNIGDVSSSDESFTVVGGKVTTYSWKILNAGYGTGLRTFVKQ